MEMLAWPVLGLVTIVAGVMAHRHPRARIIGRWALGTLFVAAGALVNAVYLATGTDYADFADASMIPFVRDTWTSLVAPRQGLFIGLLVVFEATVGLLVVTGGRRTQAALVLIMGFHVALMSFGWYFWAWSIPMLAACALLLRAERGAPAGAPPHVAEAAHHPYDWSPPAPEPGPSPLTTRARDEASGPSLTTIGR